MIGRRELIATGAAALAAAPALALASNPLEDLPVARFAFEATVLLEPTQDIGRTYLGFRRRVPIIGGSFAGPRIRGRIIPGGADWQLQRADDYNVIEADYMIETEDGTRIHVRNRGLSNAHVKGAPRRYLRTVPEFEAPDGPHAWLNQSIFVGGLLPMAGSAQPAVRVRVFELL